MEPDNSGLPVIDYQIVLFDKTLNDYREVVSLCDGTDSDVISNLQCSISVSDLISELGYTPGQLLLAKVRARNTEGYG